MANNHRFILASASPRRLALLAQVGIAPQQVLPANIDETPTRSESPNNYAQRVAREKAAVIAAHYPDAVILAADTVVACGARILPKAETEKEARFCLEHLSGRRHRVMTAVTIQHGTKARHRLVETLVRFTRLSKPQIEAYIASGQWHGKAGGYAIQGLAESFIPWINGSYSNIVGLPLAETLSLLASFGIVPDNLAASRQPSPEPRFMRAPVGASRELQVSTAPASRPGEPSAAPHASDSISRSGGKRDSQ